MSGKKITIQEKIRVALDGRSQKWLVEKINDRILMTTVRMTRKLKSNDFDRFELEAIEKILKIKF